jgi:hypothetical protein
MSLWKHRPKCSPTNFFVKFNVRRTLTIETYSPKMWATSVIFTKTTQSKQSPKERIFAKSGHPAAQTIQRQIFCSKSCAPTYLLRVARFFLVHGTKTGKMYQINTKCTKLL